MKLRLSNLIIIAEPIERKSNQSRKPKVYFDDQIAESIGLSKPLKSKGPTKPTKSIIKPIVKPLNPSARASISTEPSILDPIKQLYSQTEELDIKEDPKTKKKTKTIEIVYLKTFGLENIIKEIKPLKNIYVGTASRVLRVTLVLAC
jgi:hypothetical protein